MKQNERFIARKIGLEPAAAQDQPWRPCGSVETLELMSSAKLMYFYVTKFQERMKSLLIIKA